MKTPTINLEIKSDLSEISEAMEKLRAIADILPVTVANFIAGAGGVTGLVRQSIAPPTEGIAWFIARPTEQLQRFLEMFDADDLAPVMAAAARESAAADLTAHQNRSITEALCRIAAHESPDRLMPLRGALVDECAEINRQTLPASLATLRKSL